MTNPKTFYHYAWLKMKTRVRITNLTDETGDLVTSDKDKANFKNDFSRRFSQKKTSPTCSNIDESVYDCHLREFDITPETVKKKLEKSYVMSESLHNGQFSKR